MSDQVMDKNSKKNVVQFALMLSIICSLLITGAASGLKNLQQENMKLDKKINILKAANLITSKEKPSKEVILTLYKDHIQEVYVDNSGKTIDAEKSNALHLYFYKTDNAINGYILPINTKGLWGKIQGYLAFENDGQTVSGFSVNSHSETPGLGGEIENAWFRKNFKGKKILNSQNKFVSVGIAKGKVKNLPKNLQDHYVDGISGATLTGKYLSEGIKATLARYEPLSVSFRQKKLKAMDIHQNKE
ncbi:Na(+)-translocating NADH-quinone reductase subunit C NqrC [Candidatus Magnetomorum sp. HK-1]|nr:Na(+)-translocating NADH-quinone reductase subunit C NqrC [Candidatus Magnetomorum sp. HK-1]